MRSPAPMSSRCLRQYSVPTPHRPREVHWGRRADAGGRYGCRVSVDIWSAALAVAGPGPRSAPDGQMVPSIRCCFHGSHRQDARRARTSRHRGPPFIPSEPLPYELNQAARRPCICVGTDPFHTPPVLLHEATEVFEGAGWDVARTVLSAEAMCPLATWAEPERSRR